MQRFHDFAVVIVPKTRLMLEQDVESDESIVSSSRAKLGAKVCIARWRGHGPQNKIASAHENRAISLSLSVMDYI